jgi:hypothetical protein
MPRLGWLRAVAIAIAVAGTVDPSMRVVDRQKPEVALTADDRLPDPALVDRVSQALDGRFTVVRGPTIGAAAIVHVGNQLPDPASRRLSPAFVIAPEPREPWIAIEAIDAPARAHLHSRVPIAVRLRAIAARGRKVAVTLESGGVAVDRATRHIDRDDDRQVVPLTFAGAVMAGTVPLVVRADVTGLAESAARADVGVEIRDRRWAVLAFDRRPSWMSTFVRRAIEADPRFVVTSRIVTSRSARIDAGRPPATLSALPSLALFDAVLVGAPGELTDADVSGLESFMRERGGAVVFLPDEPAERRPYQRLLGPAPWRFVERAEPIGEPGASAFFAPNPDQPQIIWRAAVGPGRLVVSTALDSWRYREAQSGAFDQFWRLVVAEAADATPPPLEIVPDRLVLAPGEMTTARVRHGPASAAEAVRVRASADAGPQPVVVTRDGARAAATVLVVPGATRPAPDERALLASWAESRSGGWLPESRLAELGPALERALAPSPRSARWFPMRSPWWIAPFALALGAEWWMRRRHGRA